MRRRFHEANIVGVPCKRAQHCCATLRRSQNNRNVWTCSAKSLIGFKLHATSANKCQHCCGSMQTDATSHSVSYQTRLACKSTFSLPTTRTNYGIFNIRFYGSKVWNSIDEPLKFMTANQFKLNLKKQFIAQY